MTKLLMNNVDIAQVLQLVMYVSLFKSSVEPLQFNTASVRQTQEIPFKVSASCC